MDGKWVVQWYSDMAWKRKHERAEFWTLEEALSFAIQGARNEKRWGVRITSPKGDNGDLSHDVLTGEIPF